MKSQLFLIKLWLEQSNQFLSVAQSIRPPLLQCFKQRDFAGSLNEIFSTKIAMKTLTDVIANSLAEMSWKSVIMGKKYSKQGKARAPKFTKHVRPMA